MSNLIITIIAIALVAVAAIMGAYYGGTAFVNGQKRAKANQIIIQTEQIVAAYKLYRSNNLGPLASNTSINGTDALSQNGYLNANGIALSTDIATNPSYPSYYLRPISPLPGGATMLSSRILLNGAPYDVCQEIVRQVTGSTELGRAQSGDNTWEAYKDSNNRGYLTRLLKYDMDCYYIDANNNSAYDDGEVVQFHRVLELTN